MTHVETAPQRPRRALLITPLDFYSFSAVIRQHFEAAGYDVVALSHEYPKGKIGKILGKIGAFSLLSHYTRKHLRRQLDGTARFDICLIIKGRGLNRDIIGDIRQKTDRVVAYNFDSFDFNPSPLRWLNSVDRYATFDIRDAKQHGVDRVDLFSLIAPEEGEKVVTYEASAILRNHSERLRYVDLILGETGYSKQFIYIYELNWITYALNFLKNGRLMIKYRKSIHFKSLPYPEYIRVMRSSAMTIDFAHPKQTGITMRCFEAAAARTNIVTNNSYVRQCQLFDDINSTVVTPRTKQADVLCAKQSMLARGTPPARFRSIETFLSELTGTPFPTQGN